MSQLLQEIEALRQPMKELNDFIFDHPELGNEEFQAHELLTNIYLYGGHSFETYVTSALKPFVSIAIYYDNGINLVPLDC